MHGGPLDAHTRGRSEGGAGTHTVIDERVP
jgi:hypothetical protein